jgi:hypothetical protein
MEVRSFGDLEPTETIGGIETPNDPEHRGDEPFSRGRVTAGTVPPRLPQNAATHRCKIVPSNRIVSGSLASVPRGHRQCSLLGVGLRLGFKRCSR